MGRDIENTHVFLLNAPRGFLQNNTLSQQLGLGSQLKDWYTKATSIPCGHLLIDLNTKAVDSLRFCKNSVSFETMFFLPKTKQDIAILKDEHTTSLYTDNLFPERIPRSPRKHSSEIVQKISFSFYTKA